jgi:hypothetical protein
VPNDAVSPLPVAYLVPMAPVAWGRRDRAVHVMRLVGIRS